MSNTLVKQIFLSNNFNEKPKQKKLIKIFFFIHNFLLSGTTAQMFHTNEVY